MTGAGQLGRFGIWRSASLVTPQLAADIERLGFGTLWLGSSPAGDLAQAEELLDATTTLMLATSIVNMWQDQPEDVAGSFARVQRRHPGRFLLGVGAGHREATQQYARPYETLARYVDVLQAGGVRRGSLVLAALGTKVLGLARNRAAGAIPYLVPPEHTRRAGGAGQLTRHLDAGADHVCLHLITEESTDPLPGYRALAPALGLS